MATRGPQVSVVIATHERPRRLAMALESLESQSVGTDAFEVIVVDDASSRETRELLEARAADGRLALKVVRHEVARGPGGARNAGWPKATAPIVAFLDDDCVAHPDWLAEGLRACDADPGAIVQGRVDPHPEELRGYGPFTHTLRVDAAGRWFETCNIFYPRDLVERLGGFDEDTFRGHGGEDTDLGWRAVKSGAHAVFAPKAQAFHAVDHKGPVWMLRHAAHWDRTVLAFARHPQIREHFYRRYFWKWTHYALLRFLIALVLPRRWWVLRQWLARPYALYLLTDDSRRAGPLLAPYIFALDFLELAAMVRGSIRYRMLVI